MSMMALCYAHAVGYAMTELVRRRGAGGARASLAARGRVALRLCRATLGVFRGVGAARLARRMPDVRRVDRPRAAGLTA